MGNGIAIKGVGFFFFRCCVLCLCIGVLGACSSTFGHRGGGIEEGQLIASGGGIVHRVRYPGESLSLIAQWYTGKMSNWRKLLAANPGLKPERMLIGQSILIPKALVKTESPLPRTFLSKDSRRSAKRFSVEGNAEKMGEKKGASGEKTAVVTENEGAEGKGSPEEEVPEAKSRVRSVKSKAESADELLRVGGKEKERVVTESDEKTASPPENVTASEVVPEVVGPSKAPLESEEGGEDASPESAGSGDASAPSIVESDAERDKLLDELLSGN